MVGKNRIARLPRRDGRKDMRGAQQSGGKAFAGPKQRLYALGAQSCHALRITGGADDLPTLRDQNPRKRRRRIAMPKG